MKSVCRLGDYSKGHSGFPPTPIITTPATKTYVNSLLVATVDATLTNHTSGRNTHSSRTIVGGSSKTIVENKNLAREDDPISCGDTMGSGSTDTFVGG